MLRTRIRLIMTMWSISFVTAGLAYCARKLKRMFVPSHTKTFRPLALKHLLGEDFSMYILANFTHKACKQCVQREKKTKSGKLKVLSTLVVQSCYMCWLLVHFFSSSSSSSFAFANNKFHVVFLSRMFSNVFIVSSSSFSFSSSVQNTYIFK